jgi:HAD superfamily hydrolase (TIGR01490 family)
VTQARTGRPRRAAFFDVDKTLLPGSSLYLFARGLYRRGFYDLRDVVGFAFGQVVFRLTGAEGRRGMEAAREHALAFIEGKRRSDLTQLGHDIVVEVIGPRIYPGMRRVIDAHHANGDKTYLVTAAPRELAERIAAYLGMDGALGTEAELVDGVYTGRLVGPVLHGPAKLDAVRALAGEREIDLRLSSAYSDSVNDLPLLQGVGHPVAVNPDRMLRELAAERGWPVQDFRRRRRLWLVWLPTGASAAGAAVVATVAGRRLLDWRRSRGPSRRGRRRAGRPRSAPWRPRPRRALWWSGRGAGDWRPRPARSSRRAAGRSPARPRAGRPRSPWRSPR